MSSAGAAGATMGRGRARTTGRGSTCARFDAASADHDPAQGHGPTLGLDPEQRRPHLVACIGWTAPHDGHLVLCTAYVGPADIRKKQDTDYSHVPRLHQAGPPPTWPPPAPLIGDYRWPGPHHHYGQLDGRDLEPPETVQQWLWLTR